MKTLSIIVIILLTSGSCKKEETSDSFHPFYKAEVNGQKRTVGACGTTDYVCQFLKDTAMFTAIGCASERAGFYLRGKISDGTYILDNVNQAWYDNPDDFKSYKTNALNTGIINLKSKNFRGIVTIKATFEFKAVDTTTGKILSIKGGSFLMQKIYY